jgi:hypothetical protein
MTYPDHATVITGKLACIEFTHKEFEKISDKTIFFVSADDQSKTYLSKFLSYIENYLIGEPNDFYLTAKKLGIGYSLLQWWRFKEAIDLMYKWERENNHRFKYIHKLRVDFEYSDITRIYSDEHKMNMDRNDVLYNFSDLSFGGRREFVCVLQSLCEFIKSLPYSVYHYCLPINVDQLVHSKGLGHTAFYLSANIQDENMRNVVDVSLLNDIYPQSRDECLPFYKSFLEKSGEYMTPYGPIGEYPEHYFTRFLNLTGIRHTYSSSDPYSGALIIERLIANETDKNFLNAIRNKNIDFLNEFDWNTLSVKWIQGVMRELENLPVEDNRFSVFILNKLLKSRDIELFNLDTSVRKMLYRQN